MLVMHDVLPAVTTLSTSPREQIRDVSTKLLLTHYATYKRRFPMGFQPLTCTLGGNSNLRIEQRLCSSLSLILPRQIRCISTLNHVVFFSDTQTVTATETVR